MFYDVRITIGMMFTLIGTILAAFGLGTRNNPLVYGRVLESMRISGGLVLLAFGVIVHLLGRSGQMRIEKQKK